MRIVQKMAFIKQRFTDLTGSTGISFKSRFNQYKLSLNSDKGNQTTLSKFYKAIKNGISQIKWSILHKIKK